MQRQSGCDSRSRLKGATATRCAAEGCISVISVFFSKCVQSQTRNPTTKSTQEHKLATQLIDITTNKPTKIGLHFPIILKIPRAYAPKTQKDRAQNPLMNLFSPGKTHKFQTLHPPYTFLKIHCRHFMQNTINSNISKQKPHKNIQILTKTTTLR